MRFFISPHFPSAVSLKPCGARLKFSGVLLWSHVQSAVGARRSFATASRLKQSRVLLRLHVARLAFDGVLLWPHALAGCSATKRAKAKRHGQLFRHLLY